jgi:hypothetical protein
LWPVPPAIGPETAGAWITDTPDAVNGAKIRDRVNRTGDITQKLMRLPRHQAGRYIEREKVVDLGETARHRDQTPGSRTSQAFHEKKELAP